MIAGDFANDIRLVLRRFRKKPVAAALAVATLAAGIGATTSVFGVLNAVRFRHLPVRNPAELAELSITMGPSQNVGFSLPMVRSLMDAQEAFSSVIGFSNQLANAEVGNELSQINVWPVTANFFPELGIAPAAGRLIAPGDTSLVPFASAPVAVLGYGFWQREYGGDAAAVGKTIRLEGKPYTIIGVTPRGFSAFSTLTEPDVMTPLGFDEAPAQVEVPGLLWIHLVGRLKPGITFAQARAGLAPIWTSIKSELVPPSYAPQRRANFLSLGLNVRSAATGIGWMNGGTRFADPLWLALALAAVVLAVACLNVAGLMVARTAGQSHEIGIRLALGASVWSIRRQAVAEALVLSTLGSALGLLIAQWAAPAVARFMFQESTGTLALQLAPDWHVMTLVCAIVAGICVLFGAMPTRRLDRRSAISLLAGSTRVADRVGRLSPALVAAQVALALVVSIDAGLLVRTLEHVANANPGFDRANIIAASLMPKPGMPYAPIANGETNAYDRRLLDAIRLATGNQSAALAKVVPLSGADWLRTMAPESAPAEQTSVAYDTVSPEFITFLGLTVSEGRDFTWADDSTRPRIAIVSESLARRLFPGKRPIGEHINFGPLPTGQHIEIVGVVKDFKLYDVKNGSPLTLLIPLLQDPEGAEASVLLRGPAVFAPIRKAVADAGPEYVVRIRSVDEISGSAMRQEQLAAIAGSVFGTIAVGLAALGLYGLLSYVVSRRSRELAIRAALGGGAWALMRLVLGQGAAIVAAGAALGALAAAINVRWLQSLLFGIGAADALRLAIIPLALAAATLAASTIPAVRAARADPLILMRDE